MAGGCGGGIWGGGARVLGQRGGLVGCGLRGALGVLGGWGSGGGRLSMRLGGRGLGGGHCGGCGGR